MLLFNLPCLWKIPWSPTGVPSLRPLLIFTLPLSAPLSAQLVCLSYNNKNRHVITLAVFLLGISPPPLGWQAPKRSPHHQTVNTANYHLPTGGKRSTRPSHRLRVTDTGSREGLPARLVWMPQRDFKDQPSSTPLLTEGEA